MKLKSFFALVSLFIGSFGSLSATSPTEVTVTSGIYNNSSLTPVFVSHGSSGTLAYNVQYSNILEARQTIEKVLGKKLLFFRDWNPNGEAHITVVTPPEFSNTLGRFISMEDVRKIALENSLQQSRFKVEAVGSGHAILAGQEEETYFFIVTSPDLVKIRQKIHTLFVARGGTAGSWDPAHYFPHITIGFTRRDLHEADGVIKDVIHSVDKRFSLRTSP